MKIDDKDIRGDCYEKRNHNSCLPFDFLKKNGRSRFTYQSSCSNSAKEKSGRTRSHSAAQVATPSIQEHIHN